MKLGVSIGIIKNIYLNDLYNILNIYLALRAFLSKYINICDSF